MITALAWVITAGIVTAAPWALVRSWRSPLVRPWALAWVITAYFAVQEMWMAEYRLELAKSWQAAYWRDIGRPRQELQQSRLELRAFGGDDALFHPVSTQAARLPHAHNLGGDLSLGEPMRNSRRTLVTCATTNATISWPLLLRNYTEIVPAMSQETIRAEGVYDYHIQSDPTPNFDSSQRSD